MAYVYLSRTFNHVPCVGLDVGSYRYECIGPAEKVIYYKQSDGSSVPIKSITIDGTTYKHNLKIRKKWGTECYTARNTLNSIAYFIAKGPAEAYTEFRNYEGNTWRIA